MRVDSFLIVKRSCYLYDRKTSFAISRDRATEIDEQVNGNTEGESKTKKEEKEEQRNKSFSFSFFSYRYSLICQAIGLITYRKKKERMKK